MAKDKKASDQAAEFFKAYQANSARIAELQKLQNQYKKYLESEFAKKKTDVLVLPDRDFKIVREKVTVSPFQNPGYSFFKLSMKPLT
jgi:NADH:ubiquinone oxidoreductase subunit E